jgi:uncharacterized membrane protein
VAIEPIVAATIVGMAVLTYLTRIGGVWLAGRVAQPERLEAWLRPVPGAILAAFVAPAALAAGWRGLVALALVVVIATRTGSVLLAAALGTGLIALLRW